MIGDAMDKIKVGIPRGLFYDVFRDKWRYFFEQLDIEVVESGPTTKETIALGKKIAGDEMCLSFQVYLGHIVSLQNCVDYVVVPRIDNYGPGMQTCTNFLAAYDIVHNLIDIPILNYNIDYENHETEKKGFYQMGRVLKKPMSEIKKAYHTAYQMDHLIREKEISKNYNRFSKNGRKILLVGHAYTLHDSYFMDDIVNQITAMHGVVIYSDQVDEKASIPKSVHYSKELYWKFQKISLGAIALLEHQLDGVIFISTFPCGPDSLVNELVMRKLTVPHLNLVIDDMDAMAGIETRIESFMDMIYERK